MVRLGKLVSVSRKGVRAGYGRDKKQIAKTGCCALVLAGLTTLITLPLAAAGQPEMNEVQRLRYTAAQQKIDIARLKRENDELRKENDQLKQQITLLEQKLAGTKQEQGSEKPDSDEKLVTHALKDIPFDNLKKTRAIVGQKVFGSVEVINVKPDPKKPDSYIVIAWDTTCDGLWGARWEQCDGRWAWWGVRCYFQCSEQIALKLDVGEEMNIVGTVGAIRIERDDPSRRKPDRWVLSIDVHDWKAR